jgi:phosphohistidine phosphatase
MNDRELLVLRHAKSSWDSDAETDFDRPLAKRGKRDAVRMAAWLTAEGLVPALVVSSPAKRARQTARRVARETALDPEAILYDERIYGAGMHEVLTILAELDPAHRRVMLVGHNPTLESLVSFLGGAAATAFDADKFLPTCALAWFRMPDLWTDLEVGSGSLQNLVRPRTLD